MSIGFSSRAPAPALSARPGRLFYGSEPFFRLFRLHQHLYERLQAARAASAAPNRKVRGRGPLAETLGDCCCCCCPRCLL